MPKVSVVIPAYNADKYIDQCLNSVRSQTLTDIEIIVIDDGSTDSTLSKVRVHAHDDERIVVLEQKNMYAGVARNNGLAIAKGEYLAFLDADDFLELDMLAALCSKADETKADVVVCASSHFDEITREVHVIDYSLRFVDMNRVYAGTDLSKTLFQFCVGWPWDKLFKTSFIREHALQFQDQRTTNDAFFVFMSLALAQHISFVDKRLVLHRTNNANSLEYSRNSSWENACNAISAIEVGLREEGLYESFKQSFINWAINFSLWNYQTLEGNARDGLLCWMEKDLVKRLPADLDNYFFEKSDYFAATILREDRHALRSRCLGLYATRQDLDYLREENEKLQKMIKFEIDWRDAELADKNTIIEGQLHEIDSIKASKTYRFAKRLSRMLHAFKKR